MKSSGASASVLADTMLAKRPIAAVATVPKRMVCDIVLGCRNATWEYLAMDGKKENGRSKVLLIYEELDHEHPGQFAWGPHWIITARGEALRRARLSVHASKTIEAQRPPTRWETQQTRSVIF